MKRMRVKLLSYVLVVLMIVSLIPVSAFASEEAMSDEFKAYLNEDGKFVMNSIKPSSLDEAYWYFNETEYMWDNYPDLRFDNFSDDYSSCTIYYKWDWSQDKAQEEHVVEIVYNYDESVKAMVDDIVRSLPKGEEFGYYFSVKDMELLSWWANSGEINTMIDYSGELKSYLNYKNFVIDCRMGMDSEFYTEAYGEAPFSYDDIIYDIVGMGVKAEHVIYVPDGTATTKDALMAAVKSRVDEYLGTGVAKISYGGQGIREYYVALYDDMYEENNELLEACKADIAEYQALVATENENIDSYNNKISEYNMEIETLVSQILELTELKNSNPENAVEYDMQIQELDEARGEYESKITELNDKITQAETARYEYDLARSQCELDKMNYESQSGYIMNEKEYILSQYDEEDGEFNFLQNAAGDYWFNMEIGDVSHMFVVIVDSDGMVNPQYRSSDVATDVTVSSGNNSIPLDTRINVDQLTSGAVYEKIIKTLNVEDNLTFDISLYSCSLEKNITKLSNGKFEVNIPVGSNFKDKSLVVYYVDDKLGIQEFEVTVKDGYAIFETDHFSIYTLAEATVIETEDNKVTVSEETVNEAIKNAGTNTTVVIELDKEAENVTKVELPVASVRTVADAKKEIQIETSVAVVTFDTKALEKIVKDAGENAKVELNVDKIKKDDLNTKQKEAIKEKTVEMVISAELLCNDKLISGFGGGKVKIKVPFTLPKGTEGKDYKVIYVADDGKIEEIPTQYKDSCIIMELEHFSEYVIVREVEEQPNTNVDTNNNGNVKPGDNANVYIWFGLLGMGTVVAYKARRKSTAE